MTNHTSGRQLSFDERLAAEAAFSGRPFNSKWSQAARIVYDGILLAMGANPSLECSDSHESTASVTELGVARTSESDAMPPTPTTDPQEGNTEAAAHPVEETEELPTPHEVTLSRERAIEAGGLIEVTPLAKSVGVPYVVGMTRPAWNTVVTASDSIPEAAHEGRLRDILMALRLRLMSGPVTRSVIDFPALLTFPPNSVPQPHLLLAAFHDNPHAPTCITLLLPRELSLLLQHDQD